MCAMVKSEKLLQIHQSLEDFELLSVISYCQKILDKPNKDFEEEFNHLVSFFFGDDVELAIKTLQNINEIYKNEYFKRHQN